MIRIGFLIKENRLRLGWNQRQLAEIMEVDPTYISYIESFSILPSEERVRLFAEVLGEDPDRYSGFLKQEKIFHKIIQKAKRRTGAMAETALLTYFLEQTTKTFDINLYSAAAWLMETHLQLQQALRRGVRIRMAVAAPSARNAFERMRRKLKDHEEKDAILHQIQLQQLRIYTSLRYLRSLSKPQTRGDLQVRLSSLYTPTRIVITDESFCFYRPDYRTEPGKVGSGSTEAKMLTKEKDAPALREQHQIFEEIWGQADSIDWDDKDLFGHRIELVTPRELARLLKETTEE